MAKYEVLGRGHHVIGEDGKERTAAVGEIVELTEQAAAPFVPWRLKPLELNATESAIELAAEHGVDLSAVQGTGAGGRITKPDVERAIGNPQQ